MDERARLRLVLALSLGAAAVVILGLPALFLTLPDPAALKVADIDAAGRGVYVRGDGSTWRLLPSPQPRSAPGSDAPALRHVDDVVVVVRQPAELVAYRLRRQGSTPLRFSAEEERAEGHTRVVLRPPSLPPGTYELEMPRESMYGGTDFAYFRVIR